LFEKIDWMTYWPVALSDCVVDGYPQADAATSFRGLLLRWRMERPRGDAADELAGVGWVPWLVTTARIGRDRADFDGLNLAGFGERGFDWMNCSVDHHVPT
jgi:hypothetical protein